jgi:hypothetical protein
MIKQSAIDGLLTIVVAVLVCERRRAVRPIATALACAAIPVVAGALLSGAPADWWGAVAGYRAQGDSLLTGSVGHRVDLFLGTTPEALKGLGAMLALAVVGWRDAPLVPKLWLGAAALGVLGGGNFHAHYYIQLAPPLSLLGAFGVVAIARRAPRLVAPTLFAVAAIVLVLTIPVAIETPGAQARSIWPADPHLTADEAVARWVRAHSRPRDSVQVLWGAASIYYLADRDPSLRYMWRRPIESVPGALEELRRLLARSEPALVVLAQDAEVGDPSGRTALILRARYRLAAVASGIPILARATAAAP